MIAIDIAKRVRASRLGNLVVRRALRALRYLVPHLDRLAAGWRICGTPQVTLQGVSFRMLGKADDPLLDALYYQTGWESGETTLFAILAQETAVALDIGANTGVYSLLSTGVSDTIRVIAAEPTPANAERLRANLRLNGVTRVTAIETALGATEGLLEFTVPADGSMSDTASAFDALPRAYYGTEYTRVQVVQTTIDRLVEDHGLDSVGLIKLDVEFSELEVLKGAARTLESLGPVVMAEILDYDILTGLMPELRDRIPADNSEQVAGLMTSYGYAFFAVGERGILRVSSLREIADGGSNYLFVKDPPGSRFIPYSDAQAIRALMPVR